MVSRIMFHLSTLDSFLNMALTILCLLALYQTHQKASIVIFQLHFLAVANWVVVV